MLTKNDLIEKATELDFQDIGFTTAEPFDSQKEILSSRREEYARLQKGLDLEKGTDPKNTMPTAKSVVVLMSGYFRQSFPPVMEAHFGRCYQDDDRIHRVALSKRVKAFRSYLRDNGIDSKIPGNLPDRLTAARAGVGTFGKNNFFYSNKFGAQSSWVNPINLIVDQEFEPDKPTIEVRCPDWCKNTCIVSCPTRAIKAPNKLDPRLCISNLSYNSREITPVELREPMGLWVFGCDRCQNVCPRNAPWMANELTMNRKVAAKAPDFELTKLLHMDDVYFEERIWPHMFYIPTKHIWLWKMNVARAMGNSLNVDYVPELTRAFKENDDERAKGMMAWALGRLGGAASKTALEGFLPGSDGLVREEVARALEMV